MDHLVDIINQLQDVFAASDCSGIDLPQIVVVGAQSAGKSSVLENIVGKSFLPRGTGIVTRCPLVLQLVHTPDKKEDFATFQHCKKVFTDYTAIRKEIEAQTAKIAGSNRGVCSTSINLKIYSPTFLNLTLVDLPGLTKVPVGDQPQDIEDQIRNLILHYISNPNSIILAVSAANVDMATSESLKIAKQVDPEGKRTLAVLTKLDLMDEGTDGWDMLSGKVIPVKLGIIGVVNRSQKDIQDEKSVHESLKNESEFFNKTYKSIADSQGTAYLRNTVQSLLIDHIKSCMPSLKDRINDKIMTVESELGYYALNKMSKQTVLLDLVSKFTKAFVEAVKGRLKDIHSKDLYGGARVNYVFQESFSASLQNIDPLAGLDKETLLAAMRNASGVSPTVFVDGVAFELIVKTQIKRLLNPSIKCVKSVYTELNKIGRHCLNDEEIALDRYPNLKTELDILVKEILDHRLPLTEEKVTDFIDVQGAYINSSHPDFMPEQDSTDNENSEDDKKEEYPARENEKKSLPEQLCKKFSSLSVFKKAKSHDPCVLIQELIQRYFQIIHKMVLDNVPKYVMHFMINSVMEQLHNELLGSLLHGDLDHLMLESPKVSEKRKSLEAELERLEEATSIINNVSTTLVECSSPRVDRKSSFFNRFF